MINGRYRGFRPTIYFKFKNPKSNVYCKFISGFCNFELEDSFVHYSRYKVILTTNFFNVFFVDRSCQENKCERFSVLIMCTYRDIHSFMHPVNPTIWMSKYEKSEIRILKNQNPNWSDFQRMRFMSHITNKYTQALIRLIYSYNTNRFISRIIIIFFF